LLFTRQISKKIGRLNLNPPGKATVTQDFYYVISTNLFDPSENILICFE